MRSSTLGELEHDLGLAYRTRNSSVGAVLFIAACMVGTLLVPRIDEPLRVVAFLVDGIGLLVVGHIAYTRMVDAHTLQQYYDDRVKMIYHE